MSHQHTGHTDTGTLVSSFIQKTKGVDDQTWDSMHANPYYTATPLILLINLLLGNVKIL